MATDLNLFLAFGAGFLSFISPCTLPLYPAFISYITGMSLDDLKSDSKRMNKSGMLHTLFFLIGFSIIFIVLGFGYIVSRDVFHRKSRNTKTSRCNFHCLIWSYDCWFIYTEVSYEGKENYNLKIDLQVILGSS